MTQQVPASMTTEGVTAQQITDLQARATALEAGTSLPVGVVVQVAFTETGAVATGTTVVPNDDTIPQITEGDLYLTAPAFTPKKTTNKLRIDVVLNLGTSGGATTLTAALFKDAGANAIAAVQGAVSAANIPQELILTHFMTAGSLAATTFTVRAGAAIAGTTTLNGVSAARKLGGVMSSYISITEIVG